MATIRKRGERQWEARIRRKGYPVTCRTFDTRSDAEKWSREIESEMDRGLFVTRREAESTTLYEVFDRYLDNEIFTILLDMSMHINPDPVRYAIRTTAHSRPATAAQGKQQEPQEVSQGM